MAEEALVLVVDDQPHILLTLEYMVRRLGNVRTMTATNGEEAVQLAVKHRPIMILMDVMMPHVDGYKACSMIREAWGNEHDGQIWFVTARGSNYDHETANKVGANDMVQKPFDAEDLILRVKNTIEQAMSNQAA